MKKQIMSIAATAALLSTGALAFDTNPDGDILTRGNIQGNYKDGVVAANALTRAITDSNGDRLKGDALIFPAFDMSEGWSTEIVLRNHLSDRAILAKAVLYAADDSRELIDFNIYLSANDQTRFTIGNDVVTSTDDSIVSEEIISDNPDSDKTHTFANIVPFSLPVKDAIGATVEKGYVVVYGMAETKAGNTYHNNHGGLFEFYRGQLDARRGTGTVDGNNSNWRIATTDTGVFTDTNTTIAPNLGADGNLSSVDANALAGYERLINANSVQRDLRINATALSNFTDDNATGGQIVLWTPGEYAAIADRDINATGSYQETEVLRDTETFIVNSATYTYGEASDNVSNRLILTQPTKRFLVQLGKGSTYWQQGCVDSSADAAKGIVTGLEWGFKANLDIFNESEGNFKEVQNGGLITSPRSSLGIDAYCNELQSIDSSDLEKPAQESSNDYSRGFINYKFTKGIPAIITQMSANKIDDENARINWNYAPATK